MLDVNTFQLIGSIIIFWYLSSNPGITSTVNQHRGEEGGEKWSNLFLKLYFSAIALSVLTLAIHRQFLWNDFFDLVAIVCIALNLTLLLSNLMSKSKWYSTTFVRNHWINALLVEIPLVYVLDIQYSSYLFLKFSSSIPTDKGLI